MAFFFSVWKRERINEIAVNLIILHTHFLSSDSKGFEVLYSACWITHSLSKQHRVYIAKTKTYITKSGPKSTRLFLYKSYCSCKTLENVPSAIIRSGTREGTGSCDIWI